MKYRVDAYHCKVGSLLELEDGVIPAGVVYPLGSEELFIVCLAPLEQLGLPEEKEEGKEEEPEEPGVD